MAAILDRPLLAFDSAVEWERWLEANPGHDGIRLRLRKKISKLPGILRDEAVDVALCHGWIDGQAGSIDADYHFLSFSPRRVRSPWSQVNQGHVARLISEGRMRPAGHAEIDRARADGRWDAAYRMRDAPVPADLQSALDENPEARAMFDVLSSQNRFAILFRTGSVKRAETRARRIATYISMLARGETIYPQKTKGSEASASDPSHRTKPGTGGA